MHINQNSILVGDGNGDIITIDPKTFNVATTKRIHEGSIFDILEEDNYFITVGDDGIINFVDKRKMEIFKSFNVESPLKQIIKHNDKYYLAGIQAFTLDQNENI